MAQRRSNIFGLERKTIYHRRPQEERKERERQVREANKLKAQLRREELAEERERIKADRVRLAREKQERARRQFEAKKEKERDKREAKREASSYTHMPSRSEIEAAYKRGARTLKEAIEMAGGRMNPRHNPEFFVVAPSNGSRPPVSRHYSLDAARDKRDSLNARGGDYAVFAADIDTHSRTGYRMQRVNPKGSKGKFERCVKAVTKRGGARDPKAVCGAMEQRYRGNPEDRGGYVIGNVNWVSDLKFAKRQALKDADASRRPVTVTDYRTGRVVFTARPVKLTRGNPPSRKEAIAHPDPYGAGRAFAQMSNANRYSPSHDEFLRFVKAWARQHGVSGAQRHEAEGQIRNGFHSAYWKTRGNPAASIADIKAELKAGRMAFFEIDGREYAVLPKYGNAWIDRATMADLKRVAVNSGKRRNPAAEAVKAYEEFHGRKPDESVTVKRQVHIHRHLAGAGQLRKMKIQSVDGKRMVTLSRFGNALLAFNEAKNQLFVEGGSQSVDLKAFGIRTQHEVETLGKVVMLDYFTRKDHLGSEGGTAVYRHKFRTVNEDGRPVTVKILRYPDLIYFTLDKHLVFSGGDYEILAEGIDK